MDGERIDWCVTAPASASSFKSSHQLERFQGVSALSHTGQSLGAGMETAREAAAPQQRRRAAPQSTHQRAMAGSGQVLSAADPPPGVGARVHVVGGVAYGWPNDELFGKVVSIDEELMGGRMGTKTKLSISIKWDEPASRLTTSEWNERFFDDMVSLDARPMDPCRPDTTTLPMHPLIP